MLRVSLLSFAGLAAVASAQWIRCEDLVNAPFSDVTNVTVNTAVWYAAGSTINIDGPASVCQTTAKTDVDMCRVTLNIRTSDKSSTYSEIWLPNQYYNTVNWNGKILSGGTGGIRGCLMYDDMQYTTALGFASVGHNAGHNGTSGDGSSFLNNNEVVLDWSYRGGHSAIVTAKQLVQYYYSQAPSYSYYVSCSTGGRQGMKAAQMYPDDFDGIIAGSAASDWNHHVDWTSRFILLTGTSASDPKFLTSAQWTGVHAAVLNQCDAALDGVADGFLEDSTICKFDSSVLLCSSTNTASTCLTSTQVGTVNNVYSELYDQSGLLLYPKLSIGAELQSFQMGPLGGTVQGTSASWLANAVWNNSAWDPMSLSQADFTKGDDTDVLHGSVSSYSGDLSGLRASGAKLLTYHGMDDPLIAGEQSQRYYLHVAATMGLDNTQLDDFFRFYRVSGLSHCGINANGAWAFGQNIKARNSTFSVIDSMMSWVEDGVAPDYLIGDRWVNGDVNQGLQFQRKHCRFPYRSTYKGNGADSNSPDSWTCELISNWNQCGPGSTPRLCGGAGSSDTGA